MANISFVIPAYNATTTLAAAVDSIFADNFSLGDEVIIVDDCSTDTTTTTATELARTHAPHITVLLNPQNKGCPATRNVGIAAAKNALIFNLDADNILVPGMIRSLKDSLEREAADLAAFARYDYFIDNPKRITHYWHCRPGTFTLADLLAGHINPGPGGNFLYTKSSWERIGGYWEYGKGLHEAWGFTLKQLTAGHRMVVVPGTHYLHRHGHASLFATESKRKDEEYALTQKMITPYLDLLEDTDHDYVLRTPSWQQHLDTRPLKLKGVPLGKNGAMKRTWYSFYRTLQHLLTK